ncbi:MAG: 4-hydroxy-tetrahydrodipicolinate synthase [Balneolaceae bacterium]|nr:4-hydroxy-tetrahydrodipicolinate synthase [Balneolaceae bacterium]MCH8547512.1 4-hydroxy-tetrahydrodipicolinate synthase [Balneolaceae bacterium]
MKATECTLWTALITPMKENGEIHFDDLNALIKQQEQAGNGVLLLGSTGEGLALKESEKRTVVDYVCALSPKIPIMAGVGGFNLDEQKEWIGYCNNIGVDAFLLVTPFYAKPGAVGQAAWFSVLLDEADAHCMIYNVPSRTGVELSPEALKQIADHENCWSVKEAGGSIVGFEQMKAQFPDLPFYAGDDALYPYLCVSDCAGLVSVASNVWPEQTRLYVDKGQDGELIGLTSPWSNSSRALFTAPNPVPVKVLMKAKGMIESASLRPPLTENEEVVVEELLAADEKINKWYNQN